MSAQELAAYAGIVISLILAYVPGLAPKWDALQPEVKRLVMLGLMALVAGSVFGLACAGWGGDLGIVVTCDRSGAVTLIKAFVAAIIANQAVYKILPKAAYARAR